MNEDPDRTAAFMSPAKLAQLKQQKPPASPSAFLDQMAGDAGQQNVTHLGELCARMRAQAAERNFEPLAAGLDKLAATLPALDFGLLKPQGWLARATGKQRSAGAEFSAQYENILAAAQDLKLEVQGQQKKAIADASPIERTLVEFDVEVGAIEKVVEQGTRWLHDMREDLKNRQAASPDAQQMARIREDAARCETLVARLKGLKALAASARQVHQQAQVAGQHRGNVLMTVQQLFSTQLKNWQGRMAPVASAAGDSGSPALNLEGPTDAHRELQQFLARASAECRELHQQEQALAGQIAALTEPLKAAA
jgi:hypothetical protein